MRTFVVIVALLLGLAAALTLGSAVAQAQQGGAGASVARYDIFETPVPVADAPENPYDPAQVDIKAEFTAPSGKKATVPAFFRQDQETVVTPARERLRNVSLLKIYIGRDTWVGGKTISYVIDNVRLVKSDGSVVVIGDFERDDPRWRAPGVPGGVEHDLVHTGTGAFRADFPVEQQPNWPGIDMDLTGQDWSDVKELRFAFYPLTDHTAGHVGVEFYAANNDKFQTGYEVGKGGLKLNAWNEVAWDLSKIGDRKITRPKGPGGFFVRYAPSEVGRYRYTITRAGAPQPLLEGALEVAASQRPGFLKIAGPSARYVSYDTGKPLVLIGENVCWPSQAGLGDYDAWLTHLAASGGNYIRVWMAPWAFGIEWDKLGRYQQDRAADLDYVFALARKLNIHVMLCLDYHGFLRRTEGSFGASPYSAAKGGPCAKPTDFLTNETAKALYKQRLRYLVARYAAYDNLLSWELWNEVDIIEGYNSDIVAAWHQEMARYLRGIDPYAHIITTSYANSYGDPKVWSLPEIEYVQSHTYSVVDKAEEVASLARTHLGKYGKPFLIGEYGVNGGSGTERQDPDGLYLHNGAWAGVLSGTMGTAMTWWWDNYVEPRNLYHHWAGVAKFAADIPAQARPVAEADLRATYARRDAQLTYGDLQIEARHAGWEPAAFNTPQTFVVGQDGTIANIDNLARVLHGVRNHPKLHNPPTFELDFAQPGQFIAQVAGVSGFGGAKLKISLDGKLVVDRDFKDNGAGGREIYDYNGAYAVSVPAGKHVVKVENDGNDWVYIDYMLTGYRANVKPDYLALALSDGKQAWVWVHNRQSTWLRRARLNAEPTPIPATRLAIRGMPDGAYAVEWWDTWQAKVVATAKARASGGTLTVDVPGFTRDAACRIRG